MFGDKWNNNKKCLSVGKQACLADRRGFTLVEILVVIGVIVAVFTAISGFFIVDNRITERNRMRLQAMALTEEGAEAVRYFRDNTGWSSGLGSLSIDTAYHPIISGSSWDIVFGGEVIDGFVRSIVINQVSRDENDNIENNYNPSRDDPNTRRVVVTVGWSDRQGAASEILNLYLTNWKQ